MALAFDDRRGAALGTGIRSPLAIAAALLALVHAAAVAAMLAGSFKANIALILVEGAVYAAAVWLVLTRRACLSLRTILVVAALLRLSLLFFEPYHSTDVYRYVWDGRVQGAGINPYLYVPGDPALVHLRDEAIWSRMNRVDYAPTIYPPVAQVLFFLTTRVSETVVWMKAVLVGFEAITVYALIRLLDLEKLPRAHVIIYAWSPLAIWEFAGAGHLDAAMIAFVLLAVLGIRLGRDGLSGLALGAAVLVKFFPLVLLPALWRRWELKLPLALVATVALAYLPYALGAGWSVLGFLPGYAGEEGIRDGSGFWLARLLRLATGVEVPSLAYLAAAAAVLAALALVVTTRPDPRERLYAGGLALAATAMLALSPHYPWYFAWLLPFLCLAPSWPLIWLSTAGFVLYWDYSRYVPWMADVLYGVTFTLLVIDLARRVGARRLRSPLPLPTRNVA